MNHDNIGATIKELHEKIGFVMFDMTKNAGSDRSSKEDSSVKLEWLQDNRDLRLELADVYNDLGHAYQQIGSEGRANHYLMWSKYLGGGGEG